MTSNRVTSERKHFNNIAHQYDQIRKYDSLSAKFILEKLTSFVLREAEIPSGRRGKLLELGCGTGELTSRVVECGYSTIALDLSEKMLRCAVQKCKDKNVGFINGDCSFLPFPNSCFDLIIGNSILHHVNIEQCLHEALRTLKPGNKAIFIEPNFINPILALGFSIPYFKKVAWGGLSPDETLVTSRDFNSIALSLGFKSIYHQPITFLHHVIDYRLMPLANTIDDLLLKIPLVKHLSYYNLFSVKK